MQRDLIEYSSEIAEHRVGVGVDKREAAARDVVVLQKLPIVLKRQFVRVNYSGVISRL